MELTDLLNIRYITALESDTDSLFYQNIHGYLDVIQKTPEFISVINNAEKAYYKSVKENQGTSYKLELFNLYTRDYLTLFIKVYSPIEDYKTTNDSDGQQDPVALLYIYGIDSRKVDNWCKNRITTPYRDAKKEMKEHLEWIGERKEYELALKQFHTDFLTAYMQNTDSNSEVQEIKIPLRLHPKTGDFSFLNCRGTFNPKSQEFKVLSTLLNSENNLADYATLIQAYRIYNPESSKVTKPELAQIIKNIKGRLCILPTSLESNPDIIFNVKNVGYRLISPDTKQKPE